MTGPELGTLGLGAIAALVSLLAYKRSNRRDDFDSLRDEQRRQYDEAKAEFKEDIQELRDEVASLRAAMAEVKAENATLTRENAALNARVSALEAVVEALTAWRTLAVRYIKTLLKAVKDLGGHPPEPPDGLDLEDPE